MKIFRLKLAVVAIMAAFLAACIRVVPIPKRGDRGEAMALARALRDAVPELQQLQHDELLTANELKVMLDVASGKDYSLYAPRFETLVGQLAVVRDRRQQILLKVRQGVYKGVLPALYQIAAEEEMEEYLTPVNDWIQLAHNFRLRADFGTKSGFPEFNQLSEALEQFLGATQYEPLSSEIGELEKEYKFSESDI